jgi:CheY-like chemotaxis protein
MKLMIVDDHPGAREMIRKLLASPRVAIRECASAEEAVRTAREFKPDWITMDVHMPGIHGLAAAAALRAENPAVRIVIVAADDRLYLRRLALESGAVGYVCKENLHELQELLLRSIDDENRDAR